MSMTISHGSSSVRGSIPFTANVSATTANTEYSYALPTNTTMFSIRARSGKLQITYNNGQTGTVFFTLNRGAIYTIDNVSLVDITLYFQSSTANDVVEIQGFSG